jgi:hypothetical protein
MTDKTRLNPWLRAGAPVLLAVLAATAGATRGVHAPGAAAVGFGPGSGGGGALGNTSEAPVPPAALTLDRTGAEHRLDADLVADGTAVAITADDVTLDLNGHTITYDATATGGPAYGVYVAIGIDRVTIRNGTILQGPGRSPESPAIYLYGASWQAGPHTIEDVIIRTTGERSNGIEASEGYSFNGSRIRRAYIEVRGDTKAIDGYGGDCILVTAENRGGVEISDNILVGCHRGIQIAQIGTEAANRSEVHHNRIQHWRRAGSKAPYGILLAGKSHNVHIYDNQIISDDGRGIIVDGWGQGVPEGASGNSVYGNRIDVQYSTSATSGEYVENNVYGIRNRYSSGDNLFERNIVMVASDVAGDVFGFFIGSDEPDPLMRNIDVRDNTVIGRGGTSGRNRSFAFQFSPAESVSMSGNRYLADEFIAGDGSVVDLKKDGNSALSAPATDPAAPTGLRLARFLDSHVLQWDANKEADVYEYVVYRDGKRLPVSPRGGTFYVDVDAGGAHAYAVTALSLSGRESARSNEVSTANAANGWW